MFINKKIKSILIIVIFLQLYYLFGRSSVTNKQTSETIYSGYFNDFIFKKDFVKHKKKFTNYNSKNSLYINQDDNENFNEVKPSVVLNSEREDDPYEIRKVNKKIYKILEYTKIGNLKNIPSQ